MCDFLYFQQTGSNMKLSSIIIVINIIIVPLKQDFMMQSKESY